MAVSDDFQAEIGMDRAEIGMDQAEIGMDWAAACTLLFESRSIVCTHCPRGHACQLQPELEPRMSQRLRLAQAVAWVPGIRVSETECVRDFKRVPQ